MRFSVPQGTCLALCTLGLLTWGCYSAGVVDLSAADAAGSPMATRPGSAADPVLSSAMGHPEGSSSLSARADRGVVTPLMHQQEVGESHGRRGDRNLIRRKRRKRRGGGLATYGGFKISRVGHQGNHEEEDEKEQEEEQEERLGESADASSRNAVSESRPASCPSLF